MSDLGTSDGERATLGRIAMDREGVLRDHAERGVASGSPDVTRKRAVGGARADLESGGQGRN